MKATPEDKIKELGRTCQALYNIKKPTWSEKRLVHWRVRNRLWRSWIVLAVKRYNEELFEIINKKKAKRKKN